MSYVEDCVLTFHEECVKLQEQLVEEKLKSALLQDKLDRIVRVVEEEEQEEAESKDIQGIIDTAISSVEIRKALGLPLRIFPLIIGEKKK